MRKLLILLAVFLLGSCLKNEQKVQEYENSRFSYDHPNNNTKQQFEIIHVYKLYDSFMKNSKNKDKREVGELYKEQIIEPVYDACFKDAEYLHIADHLMVHPPEDLDRMQQIVDSIDQGTTETLFKETLLKSAEILPTSNKTTVCVFPTFNHNEAPMFAQGAGKITVLLSPYLSEAMIKAGLAHEYHHSVWTEKYFDEKKHTVLDNFVFEGKAVMFEKTVYPDFTLTKVDPAFDRENWDKINGDLNMVSLARSREILFGGGDLPPGFGYSEGYKMVKAYLDTHPGLDPAEWTAIPAKEIYEEGRYEENYK
ncbi:DUF2268 domain-containing putative Zn-dependent protease [Bacillus sp. T33-2]|uniref:DUF2268 domain-containing putative Zn-dependent protease n=1 Tax=Bacillus sp. T33-2 TaxID=2054168 RepID=UPI000C75DAFB|nr:DUF2268 domain-containing putative Zn-dependent protease [Bacillus sp. T33-2]PLR94115.1 Zn-dependent protease [Bacillus sp. T33-2]